MAGDRERLRTTFDATAGCYQQARPDYPEALFDALVALAPGDRLVEIGCATGKATLPLARRGLRIIAVELGPELAAAARVNLAAFPGVQVVVGAFETWQPPDPGPFDLVYAATAWHWVDPAMRYRRARELLRPGGHLAFWNTAHVFPEGGDPFFVEIQDVYEEIGEGLPGDRTWPRPGTSVDARAEIEGSGLFADVVVRRFDWETSYTAEEYLRLLDTFSNHIAMPPARRDRLYAEIRRRLTRRPDGLVRRHAESVLHVATAR